MTDIFSFRYKLGKKPATRDIRTIRLQDILKAPEALPPIPNNFNVDSGLGFKPVESDFGNKEKGDCVIADEFNTLMRFEYCQQGLQIPVDTATALDLYYREQGWNGCFLSPKPDDGLSMLNSLNWWRQKGINVAGKNYKIYAFANLPCPNGSSNLNDPLIQAALARDDQLLFQAIYFLYGVSIGVALPRTALAEFANGHPWSDISTGLSQIVGGHALYIKAYDQTAKTLTCETWGQEQVMTLDWLHEYVDELYAIIPSKDAFAPNSPIDDAKLSTILNEITGGQ